MEICLYEVKNTRIVTPIQIHVTCHRVIKIIREYFFFLFEINGLQIVVTVDHVLSNIFCRSKFKNDECKLVDLWRW
jgi:hypothetical protein